MTALGGDDNLGLGSVGPAAAVSPSSRLAGGVEDRPGPVIPPVPTAVGWREWGRRALWLVPVALVAFTLRAYVVTSVYPSCPVDPPEDLPCFGRDADAAYARAQAVALADGRGFVSPGSATDAPGAWVGPAVPAVSALGRLVGFGDAGGDRVLVLLIGSASTVIVGLVSWRLAGRHGPVAGVTAALMIALWPEAWANEGLGRPDAWLVPVAAVLIGLIYRWWWRPSGARAAAIGATAGVFTLVRADGVLVALVVAVVIAGFGPCPRGKRLAQSGILVGAALAVVAPWMLFNVARFGEPVPLGTGIGTVLAQSGCPRAIEGAAMGSRDPACVPSAPLAGPVDELTRDQQAWDLVGQQFGESGARILVVTPVRFLRLWGVMGLRDSVYYDQTVEAKGEAAWLGWIAWWTVLPVAVGGLVALHRRTVSIAPLLVLPVAATAAAGAAGAVTRLRLGADVAVIVAAGVGVAAAVAWWEQRRRGSADRGG